MVGSDWGSMDTGGFVCQDEGSGSAAQFWLRDNAESLPELFGLSELFALCRGYKEHSEREAADQSRICFEVVGSLL